MSRRVKVLAALNVLGWLVAVPLLLVALVDPFVDFSDWPDRVINDRRGDVQLRTPAAEPGSQVKRESARSRARRAEDDPLEAAREALAQFAPAVGAGGAAGPGAGGGRPAADRPERRRERPERRRVRRPRHDADRRERAGDRRRRARRRADRAHPASCP